MTVSTRAEAEQLRVRDAARKAFELLATFARDNPELIRHQPILAVEMLDFLWHAGPRSLRQARSHPSGFRQGRLHHYRVVARKPHYENSGVLRGWMNRIEALRTMMLRGAYG